MKYMKVYVRSLSWKEFVQAVFVFFLSFHVMIIIIISAAVRNVGGADDASTISSLSDAQ